MWLVYEPLDVEEERKKSRRHGGEGKKRGRRSSRGKVFGDGVNDHFFVGF